MSSRRYRGRHRHHTHSAAARTAAAVMVGGTAVAVLPLGLAGAAQAAEMPAVNWAPIIACESSGDPTATNQKSTASGWFQFLDSSWIAYGGGKYAARAKDATPAEQTEIANAAYARSGLTPWASSKACWGGKMTTAAPVKPTPKPKVAVKPKPSTSWKASAAQPADSASYTVKAGDTLTHIAAATGKPSWRAVYEANRQTIGDNPNLILPGQRLAL